MDGKCICSNHSNSMLDLLDSEWSMTCLGDKLWSAYISNQTGFGSMFTGNSVAADHIGIDDASALAAYTKR